VKKRHEGGREKARARRLGNHSEGFFWGLGVFYFFFGGGEGEGENSGAQREDFLRGR